MANTTSLAVINTATNTLAGEIRTPGFTPLGVSAGGGNIFVTGYTGTAGMVMVLNPQTGKFIANITLPSTSPYSSAYDSRDNTLYVGDYLVGGVYGNYTSVISLTTDAVTANVRTPNGPYALGYAFGKVYVAEAASDVVAVIDPATNRVVANITVGQAPDGIAFAGDPLIAVSCYGSGGLGTTNFIDPNTDEPVGYVQTAHGPQMVIFDWLLGEFFVVQYDGYLQGYLASAFESTTTTAGSQGSTSSSSTQSSTSEITSLIPLPGEETTTSTVEINPQMQEPNIPAFPFQPLLLAVITVALLATFFVIRRVTLKGTPERDSVTPTGR